MTTLKYISFFIGKGTFAFNANEAYFGSFSLVIVFWVVFFSGFGSSGVFIFIFFGGGNLHSRRSSSSGFFSSLTLLCPFWVFNVQREDLPTLDVHGGPQYL